MDVDLTIDLNELEAIIADAKAVAKRLPETDRSPIGDHQRGRGIRSRPNTWTPVARSSATRFARPAKSSADSSLVRGPRSRVICAR
jgi:hypothetical protein